MKDVIFYTLCVVLGVCIGSMIVTTKQLDKIETKIDSLTIKIDSLNERHDSIFAK